MSQNSKKIIYITHSRLPTEKAHGLATVKICEAFAELGYEVEIISPALCHQLIKDKDIFQFYSIKENFKIKKIFTIDLMFLGILEKITFLIMVLSFSIFALIYLKIKYWRDFDRIIFFSHDHIPLYFLSFFSKKIFYDIHHFPDRNFFYKRVLSKGAGFFVQTKWKIKTLCDSFGIKLERIVYWPNGTDVEKFNLDISSYEARGKLALPENKKIVLYTGQLFNWKGVDTLIRTVNLLQEDALIYMVGGYKEDAEKLKKEISEARSEKIIFVEFQPHHLMPLWLKSADVLVLPNTARQKVSLFYTSPMKLFEYMASGQPIVASAIPSILEILNEKNAFLAKPDDPKDFAEKINYALNFPEQAKRIGQAAQNDVGQYTWLNRALKISSLFV